MKIIKIVKILARETLATALALGLLSGPALSSHAQSPTSPPPPASKKKSKAPYTGPTTVIELPPTPILDSEGRPALDPDAHPMYNPPVRQIRDKKGHPVFDDNGKPVFQTARDLGYDEHGKKIKPIKVKSPKLVSMSLERGTLTVDGMTGKAALNYHIADLHYLYLFAPGIGIVVVSNSPFPAAKEQPNAFNGKDLTVSVGDHVLQISSEKALLGKKPQSAFVLVDRDFTLQSVFPVMGYGPIRKPPYAWPGSRQNLALKGPLEAPPLPRTLVPTPLLPPCPTGQMRKAVSPGSSSKAPPCIPIPKADPAASQRL